MRAEVESLLPHDRNTGLDVSGVMAAAAGKALLREPSASALKVLPPDLAATPTGSPASTREARTLAALNHPHVAQIHTVADAGEVHALVMELVEGETLADRIARGRPYFVLRPRAGRRISGQVGAWEARRRL